MFGCIYVSLGNCVVACDFKEKNPFAQKNQQSTTTQAHEEEKEDKI